ncbi:MAG: peptidylprolyl isomerase [Acidobacteriaceae bacterium]
MERAILLKLRNLSILLAIALTIACNRQPDADTLATVNGKNIAAGELDKYYKAQTAGAPQQENGESVDSVKLAILDQLIEKEVLLQRADKLGLTATQDEVDAKLNEIKAPYTKEQFEQKLKEQGLTEDDFQRDLRQNLTIQKLFNKEITSKINISDSDISSFYNRQKSQFNLIEPLWHLAQILVTSQPAPQVSNVKNDKAQNDSDAKRKIQRILNMLESGEDFSATAVNYSEQPNTASSGGDMGMIPESQLKSDTELWNAVNKLKPGQYTRVLPVFDNGRRVVGYSIVKLISREPEGQRELSDPRVQQDIRQRLRQSKEQLLEAAFRDVARNESKVQNYLAQNLLKSASK